MRAEIAAALDHSPRHREILTAVASQHRDVARIAYAIGKECVVQRVGDFPNPFAPGTPERDTWTACFHAGAHDEPLPVFEDAEVREEPVAEEPAGEPEPEPEPEPTPENEPVDLAGMTKNEIEAFVLEQTGVNLDTSMTKPELIAAAEAALAAQDAAANVD